MAETHSTPWRTIHSAHHHCGWDNALEPVTTVAPGETLTMQCLDAAGGHYKPGSTAADIARMDPSKVNPVTGPVFIDGAEPGDALKVTIRDFAPSGFGWSAIIPGFGLLADQFTAPRLQLWDYDRTAKTPAVFNTHASVPLKPFAGTIGVALAEPGVHDIIPPRRTGGNMDIRDMAAGTELYLPVEVCGTAIESAMDITVTLDLVKGAAPAFPRFSTPGPVTRHLDAKGYEATTGIGPDLMTAARDAVSGMIDHLSRWRGLSPEDAYLLCSVCGDLRISEVVDAPNWVVSFYFPRIVFE